MIITYWHLEHDQHNNLKAIVVPDGDIVPMSEFRNIHVLHTFEDKSVLMQIGLESNTVQDIIDSIDTPDPLSLEAVAEMDIVGSYVGRSREEIEERFPELAGSYEYTDPETQETQSYMKLILPKAFNTL